MARKSHRSVPYPDASLSEPANFVSARVAANRRNAKKSTGPRTPAGKARVRYNAAKHNPATNGLFTHNLHTLWRGTGQEAEERPAYDEYLAELRRDYDPQSCEEEQLIDHIAAVWWRLRWVHGSLEVNRFRDQADSRILPASTSIAREHTRLLRDLARLHRDLEFLQRWRARRPPRDEYSAPGPAAAPLSPSPAVPPERDPGSESAAPAESTADLNSSPEAVTHPDSKSLEEYGNQSSYQPDKLIPLNQTQAGRKLLKAAAGSGIGYP